MPLRFILFILAISTIYLSFSSYFYLPNITNYFLIITFASTIHIFFGFKHHKMGQVPLVLLLLLLWCLLSFTWANNPMIAISGFMRVFTFALCVSTAILIFDKYKELHRNIIPLLLSALFIVSYAYFISLILRENKFTYPFGNPNMASSLLAFSCILSASFIYDCYRKRSKKFFYGVVAFIWFSCALLYLKSEATIGALFLAAGIVLLLSKYRFSVLGGGVLGAVAATAALMFWPSLWYKVWPSIEIRSFLWVDTLEMIFYSPQTFFLGCGVGNFFWVFPAFRSQESYAAIYSTELIDYPHCYTLELMSEIGIIGTVLFISLLILVVTKFLQRHWQKKACITDYAFLTSLLFFFIHAQLSVVFSYINIQLMVALIIGWCLQREQKIQNVARRIVFVYVLFLVIIWKFCVWDVVVFHKDYQNAKITHEQERPSEMLAMNLPLFYESFHTVLWRHSLGSVLIDHYENNPLLVKESITVIEDLYSGKHGYGLYWLQKAVYHAKCREIKQADENFVLYCEKNPFNNELWKNWYIACEHQGASLQIFISYATKFYNKYPQDGTLVMAMAKVKILQGKLDAAKKYIQDAKKWCKTRPGLRRLGLEEWIASESL